MIKNIKLFVNDNDKSLEIAKLVKEKFEENKYIVTDKKFDLGIAIGGDGSFLRMVKRTRFDSEPYYVGINTGHLGFLQEVKIDELDKLIDELKNEKYKVSNVGIQETVVNHIDGESKFYSLNEITIQDNNFKVLRAKIDINDDFLENYTGDGLMVSTSIGSTAHNLSYGGSIVSPEFSTLQITSMAPINSKAYRSLTNSVIVPDKTLVKIYPKNKSIIVFVDGARNGFEEVNSITSVINDKKIKMLRFSHYNFPQKINEKLLSD